jgi:hypothetical protein
MENGGPAALFCRRELLNTVGGNLKAGLPFIMEV